MVHDFSLLVAMVTGRGVAELNATRCGDQVELFFVALLSAKGLMASITCLECRVRTKVFIQWKCLSSNCFLSLFLGQVCLQTILQFKNKDVCEKIITKNEINSFGTTIV